MKKLLTLITAILLATGTTACSKSSSNTTTETDYGAIPSTVSTGAL